MKLICNIKKKYFKSPFVLNNDCSLSSGEFLALFGGWKATEPKPKNEPIISFCFGLVEWLFFGFSLVVVRKPNLDKKQTNGSFFALVWLSGCFLALVWLNGCFFTSVWLKGNQTRTKNEQMVGFSLRFGWAVVFWLRFGWKVIKPGQKMKQWLVFCFGLVEWFFLLRFGGWNATKPGPKMN